MLSEWWSLYTARFLCVILQGGGPTATYHVNKMAAPMQNVSFSFISRFW